MRNVIKFVMYTDDGDEIVAELPACYEVCPRCEGRGSHVDPAIDGHGLSREDFDEDPYFEENYFSGEYDVPCHECKGLRVIYVPDALRADPDTLAKYRQQQREEAAHRAEVRAEMRFMYGGDY